MIYTLTIQIRINMDLIYINRCVIYILILGYIQHYVTQKPIF